MISIYEDLDSSELAKLKHLEPFMDLQFGKNDNGERVVFYQTHCTGLEIRDGKVAEIRKIKFYRADQIRQGFICDNIDETRMLCWLIENDTQLNMFSQSVTNLTKVTEYLKQNSTPWASIIAVPVRVFMDYYKIDDPQKLDMLDLSELRKWNIDAHDYIEIATSKTPTPEECFGKRH